MILFIYFENKIFYFLNNKYLTQIKETCTEENKFKIIKNRRVRNQTKIENEISYTLYIK